MKIKPSERVKRMGSAIFAEVAEWRKQAAASGLGIIDLGIGSPDTPPAEAVMATLAAEVCDPSNYGYPDSAGSRRFREAAAQWMRWRFGVDLDPEREILALMGSQDGLAHLALALADPGDLAIVPDPGYPIYEAGLALAGVRSYPLSLRESNGFLPILEDIPSDIAGAARFILLNYPSNPLSAVADEGFFAKLADFARQTDTLIVHDAAYSEMAFDGFRPPSMLQIAGAKEVAVEFHSLSKSYHMAGCRIAFLAGHPEAVDALRRLKANIDYGVFEPVQSAAIAAWNAGMAGGYEVASVYQRRRDVLVEQMRLAGWPVSTPRATMFVWAKVPEGWKARQISREILLHTGVVVIPGDAFGAMGEGYVRIALVQPEEQLVEAARRIGIFLKNA